MTALDRLLDALPSWILVGGKGGAGKTTCAAALAARSAARGASTLLLSTDPAGSLGDALGAALAADPAPVRGHPMLHAMQMDAAAAREAFLERWREVLVTIVDRGTYLDRGEIEGLVDAALPGADETMALLRLMALHRDRRWERVVVDTAPTGHTLRLLDLPRSFRSALALLDAMQEKHRFMVRALTHRYRSDAADAFLRETIAEADGVTALLRDHARAAMVLVARPEPLVAAESARYAATLRELGVRVGAVVVNAVPDGVDADVIASALRAAGVAGQAEGLPGALRFEVPLLGDAPMGLAAIETWGAAMWEGVSDAAAAERMAAPATRGPPPDYHDTPPAAPAPHRNVAARIEAPPAARLLASRLTLVAGKGGVGKTTAACALALAAAERQPPVLLVSTDPAPSIADALALPVGDEETPVAGAPGLVARQMDAGAAFTRFRDAYGAHVDALFDELTGGTLDAAADRRIMRDLLALAPPGIDELYALAALGETLAEGRFRTVVVDPAPTGHLLRLLEMPALALDWSHRLLRLMLRYKDAVGLGDAAQELLAFARRTRAVGELLRDPERAGAVIVALDEPLVRAESARLLAGVRGRGVAPLGVLWNRSRPEGRVPEPLPASPPLAHFAATAEEPPPRGVAELRRWARRWRAAPDTSA